MNANALFFDPQRHNDALVLLASAHLGRGEYAAAFQYADRRCRLVTPRARDYLLRAEISRRAGFAEEGARDLSAALKADPTDPLVRRSIFARGAEDERRLMARALLTEEAPPRDALRPAVEILLESGQGLVSGLNRRGTDVAGWLAWTAGAPLLARREGASPREWTVLPDRNHAFSGAAVAAAEIFLPDSADKCVSFWREGVEIGAWAPAAPFEQIEKLPQRESALTVITPVYEDFAATRDCLEALLAQGPGFRARLIVIDDASPNAEMREWLETGADLGKFEYYRNPRNLGFAATVNRGLAACLGGDVILLNADTWAPPGSLARLTQIARATPSIGTATPLSNNGELTSFPAPYQVNPLPQTSEIARLDALAWRANGDKCIDMPNGIGFCLFISRACLDAAGPLPEIYQRGYYEDVEFALRAREKGFRNVCATGVFVGHAGSLSFGAAKAALVKRNQAILESRFPLYNLEAAAFVHADPLRAPRGAVELLSPPAGPLALLVCREGAPETLARVEAERRAGEAGEPASLFCRFHVAEDSVALRGAGEAAPQSLEFSLRAPQSRARLHDWLAGLQLARIEIFDALSVPEALTELLFSLGVPVDLACGDLEWVFAPRLPASGPCPIGSGNAPCVSCADNAFAPDEDDPHAAERLARWRNLAARAQHIRPLDSMAAAFAKNVFGAGRVLPAPLPAVEPIARAEKGEALAIVVPSPCARADRLIVALGRELLRRGSQARLVVLGACADDFSVMGPGNVFVAGKVESAEYGRLFRQYEIAALMSPFRTRFFGQIDALSAASDLPKACFDWSFGKIAPAPDDLVLDPRLCDSRAAALAADWCEGLLGGTARP